MRDKKIVVKSGTSSTTLLGIIFIVLKVTNTVNWSWFWVLSPFWIPLALVVVILAFALLVALIIGMLKGL